MRVSKGRVKCEKEGTYMCPRARVPPCICEQRQHLDQCRGNINAVFAAARMHDRKDCA